MDGLRSPKVLVVDDNEANRLLAEETLRSEGYEVTLASSGEEALSIFEREPHDLVLLDIRMPGLDGFATCERLRALPSGREVPIAFLTALRDLDTYDRALRHGADDFLTKPIRPTELLSRVHVLLRIGRLSADLKEQFRLVRDQRDALVRLDLQKEQLMAFVVHDLKNPINSIGLFASLLLRDRELSANSKAHAEAIRQEVRNMTRLVFNLLDISKGEEGELRPERVNIDLDELVREIVHFSKPRAEDRNQRIEIQLDLVSNSLFADSDLLRRVVENLMDNALRHAPTGGVVTIRAEDHDDGSVLLRVIDSGTGISKEMRSRIFEKYVQLEGGQENLSRTGRGLGLVFCRMAVEAHGGEVWVEDCAPGAMFCVRIPRGN